ncbi:MAG: PKD domain-containing protein [Bacteroidia bacterium]|nr:PKD domain-containing protein [Bacteroidia bacterium]
MRYAILLWAAAWAQVNVLYQENFNTTSPGSSPSGWTLNSTDLGGQATDNLWRVDARYGQNCCTLFGSCFPSNAFSSNVPNQPAGVSGSPQSRFLYITSSTCPFAPPNVTFPALFNGQHLGSSFARSSSITIPAGTAPVKLSFVWICGTASDGTGNLTAFGEVYYSINGGSTWNILTSRTGSTQLHNQLITWYFDTITLPIPRPANLLIGFRFQNIGSASSASQPGFIVDEIKVFEESVAAPSISLSSVSPNPVCAGSPLTVSFTHSGFSGTPNFQAELLDGSNAVVATSAPSSSSPITFTIPSTLPSGTYRVRVVSGSTQSGTQAIQVINLSSFTCAASATTITAGSSVTFTLNGGAGFPSSGSLSVTFSPGGGAGSVNLGPYTLPGGLPATYTHTYSTPGTYTAEFTASMGGCTHTCQQTITVTAASTPTLTLDNLSHTQVCAGGSIQVFYTAANFPPGTQYTAQLLNASNTIIASASGPSPITLTIPSSTPTGTYTVRIQASTTPPTNSNTLNLNVLNLSAFTITCSANPSAPNAGSTVSLSVNLTPSPPFPVNVQMTPGDGSPAQTVSNTTSFPQTFTHIYNQAGTYTVTFTVSHPAPGCTLTCTQSVSVSPVITLGTLPTSACAGGTLAVPFTASGFPSGTTFTAEIRSSTNALVASAPGTSSPISVSLPATLASGTYTVQVVSGTTQSNSASIEVINLRGFSCTPSATSITAGQTVTFTLSGTGLPSSGTLSVTFTPGDGSPAQTFTYTLPAGLPATVSHTYTSSGTFTATFTVSAGGCTHTCTQNISVSPPTAPQLIIGQVASFVCAGGGISIPFDAIGFPPGTTFTVEISPQGTSTWNPLCTGTSSPISCIISETFQGGTYTLRISGGAPAVYSQERLIEVIQLRGITCSLFPVPAYVGEPITLTVGGSGLPSGSFAIEWSPGANLPSQTQNAASLPSTLTYTYTAEGIYIGHAKITHLPSGCQRECALPLAVGRRSAGGDPTSLIAVSPDGSAIFAPEAIQVELFDALGRLLYRSTGTAPIPVERGRLYVVRIQLLDRIKVERLYLP